MLTPMAGSSRALETERWPGTVDIVQPQECTAGLECVFALVYRYRFAMQRVTARPLVNNKSRKQ
eukprot:767190-Hanusia_phi.AAC.2